jgi:hypothetical protein
MFCHHANPAIIHSNQAEPCLAKVTSWITFGSYFLRRQLQPSQFTNAPIFLLALQIHRIWLAPSLTIWTQWEFGMPTITTTTCWSRALYPLDYEDLTISNNEYPIYWIFSSLRINRVWLAPSLTIWTEWSRALYPLGYGNLTISNNEYPIYRIFSSQAF